MGYKTPFELDFDVCIDNCSILTITDITDWVSVLYSNLVSVSLLVSTTGHTTGTVDITSSYINKTPTGTITCNGTDKIISGTNTLFLSECIVGKYLIVTTTNEVVKIVSITNNTTMTVDVIPTAVTGVAYYILDPYIEVNPGDLNIGTFTDGKYNITLTVVTSTDTYTKTISFYNTCSISCCIYIAVSGLKDYYGCNSCEKEYVLYVETLYTLYQSLLYNASNYKFSEADTILALLTDLCKYKNCNCT